jgi:hypothetical protein
MRTGVSLAKALMENPPTASSLLVEAVLATSADPLALGLKSTPMAAVQSTTYLRLRYATPKKNSTQA